VDGHHTHGDDGGLWVVAVGIAGIVLIVTLPVILAILQTLLLILVVVAGIAIGGGVAYLGYRIRHPRLPASPGQRGLWRPVRREIPQQGYHVLTTEQLREIMERGNNR
jgi:hypothetical protein